MSSRDAILGRVRSALGRKVSPADTATIDAHLAAHPVGLQPPRDWEPELRFRTRAEALASTVEKVSSLQSVPGAVARYLVAVSYTHLTLPTSDLV